MNKSQKQMGCGVGCLHFSMTFIAALYALGLSLAHHHRAQQPLPPLFDVQQRIADILLWIAGFPLMNFAQMLWGKNVVSFSFLIWIANSLLFGFGFAFIIKQLRKQR